jgi:endonuclease G
LTIRPGLPLLRLSLPGLRLHAALLLALLALAPWPVLAADSLCPEHYARGQVPVLLNPKLAAGTRALCFQAFGLLHSGTTRTALYSAERLTQERLELARGVPRQSEFHPEPLLPPAERAELSDYARSGFDRGHLSPSGDMPDPEAQQESFSLANMVPQVGKLNRGLWEGIESAVRTYARRRGTLFVVTGPAFVGAQVESTGRVLVPTHVWKAVLDPARGTAAAYVAVNDESGQWQVMSIGQLAVFTGIDVFPSMTSSSHERAMRLPNPTPHNRSRNQVPGVRF